MAVALVTPVLLSFPSADVKPGETVRLLFTVDAPEPGPLEAVYLELVGAGADAFRIAAFVVNLVIEGSSYSACPLAKELPHGVKRYTFPAGFRLRAHSEFSSDLMVLDLVNVSKVTARASAELHCRTLPL